MSTTVLTVAASTYSKAFRHYHFSLLGSSATSGQVRQGDGEWFVYRNGSLVHYKIGPLQFAWPCENTGEVVTGRYVDRAGNAGAVVRQSLSLSASNWSYQVYVDPESGDDGATGAEGDPIQTLDEAKTRVAANWVSGGEHAVWLAEDKVHTATGPAWDGGEVPGRVHFRRWGTAGGEPVVEFPNSHGFRTGNRQSVVLKGLYLDGLWATGGLGFCLYFDRTGTGTRSAQNSAIIDCIVTRFHEGVHGSDATIDGTNRDAGNNEFVYLVRTNFDQQKQYHVYGMDYVRYLDTLNVTYGVHLAVAPSFPQNPFRVSSVSDCYFEGTTAPFNGPGAIRFNCNDFGSNSATRRVTIVGLTLTGLDSSTNGISLAANGGTGIVHFQDIFLLDSKLIKAALSGSLNSVSGTNSIQVDGLVLRRNTMGRAVNLPAQASGGTYSNVTIEDNTVVAFDWPGDCLGVRMEGPADRFSSPFLYFSGNIGYWPATGNGFGSSTRQILEGVNMTRAELIARIAECDRNLLAKSDAFDVTWATHTDSPFASNLGAWQAASVFDDNSLTALSTTLALTNNGLSGTLNAIPTASNAATGVGRPAARYDARGFARDGSPDIGAFEFGASSTPSGPGATDDATATFSGTLDMSLASTAMAGVSAAFTGSLGMTLSGAAMAGVSAAFSGTLGMTLSGAANVAATASFSATLGMSLSASANRPIMPRRIALFIGDNVLAGNRPVSELTAINPAYDDTQADCDIWNIQTQAFEPLTPGVNTNSNVVGTTFWGFESRFRQGIRSTIPTGKVYVVKFAVASTVVPVAGFQTWAPQMTGGTSAIDQIITQLTAVAAACNAAGEPARIDGIVFSAFALDVLVGTGWRAYGSAVRELIDRLRVIIGNAALGVPGSIPFLSGGSFRDDGKATPVVLLEPHYRFTGLSESLRGALNVRRMQIQELDNEASRVRVYRTHHLGSTDGTHFNAAGLVLAGEEIPTYFGPAPTQAALRAADQSKTDAWLSLLVGDSIHEGTGYNDQLPAHLKVAQTSCNIWATPRGVFEPLQIGVNNQISNPMIDGEFPPGSGRKDFWRHGPEMVFSELLRGQFGEVFLLKGTALGSLLTPVRDPFLFQILPLYDLFAVDWDPASSGEFFNYYIRGQLVSMVDQLRRNNRRPVMGPICICLGTNDLIFPGKASPAELAESLSRFISQVKKVLDSLAVDMTQSRFIVAVPSSGLVSVPGASAADVTLGREKLENWLSQTPEVRGVDLTGYTLLPGDDIHHDTAGTAEYARALYQAWASGPASRIQPLFSQNLTELRKALRLSGVSKNNDASVMIEQAVMGVRTGFVRKLGQSKVDAILAHALTPSPTTQGEYLRSLAVVCETKWVRMELMRTMPQLFSDGNSVTKIWNEEGAFRDVPYLQHRDELRRLQEDVDVMLSTLATYSATEALTRQTFEAFGADSVPSPGGSVRGEAF